MDFTACSLPPPLAFTFNLLPKSEEVVLFYFLYLHMSKSHLHVSKSLFFYLPLLQTTVYVPHPRIELLWRHFIKKDVIGRIYASITPHLLFLELLVYPHPRLKPLLLYLSLVKVDFCSSTMVSSCVTFIISPLNEHNVLFISRIKILLL